MAQAAHPDQDGALGDWVDPSSGVSNIYTNINEVGSADNADYIKNEQMMAQETTCKFRLSDVDDPTSSSDHKIKYTARHEGSARNLTVTLYDGSTEIVADINSSLTGSYAEYTVTLNGTQADNIGNYADLFLWFTAVGTSSDEIRVSQAFFECPSLATIKPSPTATRSYLLEIFD
jgi:hypothetical protein